MNLVQRPLVLRLAFGIFSDALLGPFPETNPGSTTTRALNYFGQLIGNNIHPYTKMWEDIGDYYQATSTKELSNKSLSTFLKNSFANGIGYNVEAGLSWFQAKGFRLEAAEEDPRHSYLIATAEDQEASAQRWIKYGWINYEERKQDKLDSSMKLARIGLTATSAGGALGAISLLLGDL